MFDLVSDLHVEFWANPHEYGQALKQNLSYNWFPWGSVKNDGSDVLVMAGDTANSIRVALDAIEQARDHYSHVVVVPGNHEYYRGKRHTIGEKHKVLMEGCNAWSNVHLLDKGMTSIGGVTIGDILFVGCMGWYDWQAPIEYPRETMHKEWKRQSNDSHLRFDMYPDKMATNQARMLKQQVIKGNTIDAVKHIVVVTHTAPCVEGLYRSTDPGWDMLNGSYVNSQMSSVAEADFNKKISTWVYGHTHYMNDFILGTIRYVSHPRGYPTERRGDGSWRRPKQIDATVHFSGRVSAFGEVERD